MEKRGKKRKMMEIVKSIRKRVDKETRNNLGDTEFERIIKEKGKK